MSVKPELVLTQVVLKIEDAAVKLPDQDVDVIIWIDEYDYSPHKAVGVYSGDSWYMWADGDAVDLDATNVLYWAYVPDPFSEVNRIFSEVI